MAIKKKYSPMDIARFWSKVDVQGTGPCWEWKAATNGRYGRFGHNGKSLGAHRVAWELFNDKEIGKLYVCHHCDNTKCCNPDHMFLGTHQDNMDDLNKKRLFWKENGSRGRTEQAQNEW